MLEHATTWAVAILERKPLRKASLLTRACDGVSVGAQDILFNETDSIYALKCTLSLAMAAARGIRCDECRQLMLDSLVQCRAPRTLH